MSKKNLAVLGLAVITIIAIPLTVMEFNQQQELRGRAQVDTSTPVISCSNNPADIILVIDRSSSMKGAKIVKAKEAAKSFINSVASNNNNRIGVVTFDLNSTLVNPLSNNIDELKTSIDAITLSSSTCVQCGIKKANEEILANGRQGIKSVVILLSDGRANKIDGQSASSSDAEKAAVNEAQQGSNSKNTVYYTIGLGSTTSANFLTTLANLSGGKYYYSPTEDQLTEIYTLASQALAKGSIVGYVFNDLNNNSLYEESEPKLHGWTLELARADSDKPQYFMTNETGDFNISELCDSSYKLKLLPQAGWIQTAPASSQPHSINISAGSAANDIIFGTMIEPTPTPTLTHTPTPLPSDTPTPAPSNTPTSEPTNSPTPNQPTQASSTILLNGLLDGIGSRGDNSNPDGAFSNKNPLTPARNIKIDILDASNQLITSANGTMNFSSTSGAFSAQLDISLPSSGNYIIKATTDNHLTRLLPGIQNIAVGQQTTLPNAIFIAGDIAHDNQLNIRDYNSLIDCYSDLAAATACSDTKKKFASDLNDDGSVNQFDYNLFLREIATQPGQ